MIRKIYIYNRSPFIDGGHVDLRTDDIITGSTYSPTMSHERALEIAREYASRYGLDDSAIVDLWNQPLTLADLLPGM
jgi:hypothetical protein